MRIRHKGLRLFWTKLDGSKLPPKRLDDIREVLNALDAAAQPNDLRPIYADWQWKDGEAVDVNYEDYHEG